MQPLPLGSESGGVGDWGSHWGALPLRSLCTLNQLHRLWPHLSLGCGDDTLFFQISVQSTNGRARRVHAGSMARQRD